MIPPQSSLVKYNSPILVSTTKEKSLRANKKQSLGKPSHGGSSSANNSNNQSAGDASPLQQQQKPTVFTGSYSQSQSQTEDILNSILPPKEWTEDGQLWVQYVSSTPATRLDVVNLQEQLDLRLQQRQARETGICPVREELYAQCFGKECMRCDELLVYGTHVSKLNVFSTMNRRTDPVDHDQLLGARASATARAGRGAHDDRRVPDAVRVLDRVRHAQGAHGRAEEDGGRAEDPAARERGQGTRDADRRAQHALRGRGAPRGGEEGSGREEAPGGDRGAAQGE